MSADRNEVEFLKGLECIKRRHKPFCSCCLSQSVADAIKSSLLAVHSATDLDDLQFRAGIAFGALEAYVHVGAISTAHSLNAHRLLESAFNFAPAQVAA